MRVQQESYLSQRPSPEPNSTDSGSHSPSTPFRFTKTSTSTFTFEYGAATAFPANTKPCHSPVPTSFSPQSPSRDRPKDGEDPDQIPRREAAAHNAALITRAVPDDGLGNDVSVPNRDVPLESVEPHTPLSEDQCSARSTPRATPSRSSREPSVLESFSDAGLEDQMERVRLDSSAPRSNVADDAILVNNARPRTPSRPSTVPLDHRDSTPKSTSTPSITVTPTPPINRSRSDNDAELLGRSMAGLDINNGVRDRSPRLGSEDNRESPSGRRRRRSSSALPQVCYLVEDEPDPESKFHNPVVQETIVKAKDTMTQIATALSRSQLHNEPDSTVRGLYQQANALRDFSPPETRVVGLVGDSGVGKSSLINSLLDMEDLARAGGRGSACTCVATEYYYHDKANFLIHIDYFGKDEIKRQFSELLQAYRDYESSVNNESLTNNASSEGKKELKARANVAKATFSASFGQRLEEDRDVLLGMPITRAISTMMDWVPNYLPQSEGIQAATPLESFDNIQQFSNRLQELTSENESGNFGSPWPFIRKLRVYLKAHILSKGLVIADLPGLRDLNAARQYVTERYIRECHQVFAVTWIGRAATDLGVKEVFELARRAELANVGVICTKSDDIKWKEARTDWPSEAGRIDAFGAQICDAQQRKAQLYDQIIEVEAEMEDALDDFSDLAREKHDLDKKLKKIKQEEASLEYQLQNHIIGVRNTFVTRSVNTAYRGYLPGSDIKTFCVSNTIYWKNRGRSAQNVKDFIILSGIPDLRLHCKGIVSESHFRATATYIRDEIPAFLGSIELWIQAGAGTATAERKQELLDKIQSIQDQLRELRSPVSDTGRVSSDLQRKFDENVYRIMTQRSRAWGRSAQQISEAWHGWHHASFSAFCRNYGNHYTKTIGHCHWNEEAIAAASRDLRLLWTEFTPSIEDYFRSLLDVFDDHFGQIIRGIFSQGYASSLRPTLDTLMSTLRHRHRLVHHAMDTACENFLHSKLHTLKSDMLSGARTSIIGQIMENSYHRANMEYGSGSDLRRKGHIIRDGFCADGLMDSHKTRAKRQFLNIAKTLGDEIDAALDEQMAQIDADLNILKNENALSDSERNPRFRAGVERALLAARLRIDNTSQLFEAAVGLSGEDAQVYA